MIYTTKIASLLKELSDDEDYDPECVIQSKIDFTQLSSIEEFNEKTTEVDLENKSIKLSELVIFTCPGCSLRQTANYYSFSSKRFCGNKGCEYGLEQKKLSMYYVTRMYLLCKQQVITPTYTNIRGKMTTRCMECKTISIQPFMLFKNKSCTNELCKLYLQRIDDSGEISFGKNLVGKKNIDYKKLYESEGFEFENPSAEIEMVRFKCPSGHVFIMKFSIFKKWIGKREKNPCKKCISMKNWEEVVTELSLFGIVTLFPKENQIENYHRDDKIEFMCPNGEHRLEFDRSSIQSCVKRNNGEYYRCKFCEKHGTSKAKIILIKEKFKSIGIKLLSHNHEARTIEYRCVCHEVYCTSYSNCLEEQWKGCSACVYKNPDSVFKMIHGRNKLYKLSTGDEIYTQGYEGKAMDYLLSTGIKRDDIVYGEGLKSVMLRYKMKDKFKTYFPDMFIKSDNTIVEVKCTTFMRKGELSCKIKACLNEGYNFKLIMFDDRSNIIYIDNISKKGERKFDSLVGDIKPEFVFIDVDIKLDNSVKSYNVSKSRRTIEFETDSEDEDNEDIEERKEPPRKKRPIIIMDSDDEGTENEKSDTEESENEDDKPQNDNEAIDDEKWGMYEDVFVSSLGRVKNKSGRIYKMQSDKRYKIVVNGITKSYRVGRLMAIAFDHPDKELLRSATYAVHFVDDIINLKNLKIITRSEVVKTMNKNKKLEIEDYAHVLEKYKNRVRTDGVDSVKSDVNIMTKVMIKHYLSQYGMSSLSRFTKPKLVEMFMTMITNEDDEVIEE